jgi:hypothetical protein
VKPGIAALAGAAAIIAIVAVVLATSGGGEDRHAAETCPPGQRVVRADIEEVEGGEREEGEREREVELPGGERIEGETGDYESFFKGRCAPLKHPESARELTEFSDYASNRLGSDSARAFGRAVERRARMERSPARVAGAGGSWEQYGHGPLIADDATYPTTHGDGFGKIEGRVNDLLYVGQEDSLYAAVAQGGLWRSTDMGDSWRPIGDDLPIQSTGAVGYTPARGGTLIVATGDHAFSNDYAGAGTFWSTDNGRTWTKSRGAPVGALSFRVAVDPTDPDVVYLATGFGLFRSDDAARSFENVNLPTGECQGDSQKPNCFFANVVTDVAVQPTDELGHEGGAVIAAVGWRDGLRPNLAGVPAAPANGLYRSETGAVGSFARLPDDSGFTPHDRAGRVEFGVTDGPGQDSRYLYAVSQDAQLFAGSLGGEQDIPLVGTPSVLDGIYVSDDFGITWTKMESREEFYNPANGSALAQLTPLGIAPGFQVTYNQWIKPDPTRQVGGIPTRVLLGMEEPFQTTSTVTPQNGHSSFSVIGEYTSHGGACLVVPEQCGTAQQAAGHTTTHPDQHDGELVPDGEGGVTLFAANDGGVYKQHKGQNEEFDNLSWGDGANDGFETLLPYGAAMAKNGTVYAGLQDNGQLKILPNGDQHAVYVGDGINALVDPDNSDHAWDELPLAGTNVTTDGGVTWTSNDPGLKDPDFVAPLVMDPTDADHVLVAGRNIAETTAGVETTVGCAAEDPPEDCAETDWKYVYDLGTRSHPADPDAAPDEDPADTDPPNHASAMAVNGDNVYVGFCGDCDPVKRRRKFENGFATNVGGAEPPRRGTSNGWHIAEADGLPGRIITDVTPDPDDPETVYVTLGASAARYWAPIGSMGEDASDAGRGHVFKSTDAGETFKDVSGDLPNVQATSIEVRNDQLVVGTAIGMFISSGRNGGSYGLLGRGLPPVAVYSTQFKPGDPDLLMAATFGRGIWTYRFTQAQEPAGGGGGGSGGGGAVPRRCRRSKPYARFSHRSVQRARRAPGRAKLRLRGIARVRKGCGRIKRVQVSVQRRRAGRCRYLGRSGRFGRRVSCRKPRYVRARGTRHWKFVSKHGIARGRYRLRVRSVDTFGRTSPVSRRRHTSLIVHRR